MTTLLIALAAAFPTQPLFAVEPRSTELPAAWPSISELVEPSALGPVSLAPASPKARPADEFPEMEYTYIEANYTVRDSDDADDTLDGWNATGSLELPLNFFLQATFSDWSGDADVQGYRVGAGWHIGLISRLDAYGIISFDHLEYDDSTNEFDDDGTAAEVGLRFLLTHRIEANGRVLWADTFDEDAGGGVGARFYFSDMISAGANYDVFGDDEIIAAGLRLEF